MSAAFDSRVSGSAEVMSSTLPVLVPGIGEANLGAIASLEVHPEIRIRH